jgi:hypothetical protein
MNKSLIPIEAAASPNYFCTFNGQSYYHPQSLLEQNKEKYAQMDANREAATLLNEETLLGDNGLARTLFPENRKDLFFLLDDGWDVPIISPNDYYGSCILDTDKFPSFTGNPAERLGTLNAAFKDLGWRGVGLWIACQEAPAIIRANPALYDDDDDDVADLSDMEPKYWVERMDWMNSAGIEYWKVDWGTNCKFLWFREMLSKLARKYAPHLIVEHAHVFSPLNTPLTPEEVKIAKAEKSSWVILEEGGPQGRLGPSNLAEFKKIISFSDVFRMYDISGELGIPTMIERAAQALAAFDSANPTQCLLNCEIIPYLAAGLGLCIGIMSHPEKTQQFHPSIILNGEELCENLAGSYGTGEGDMFRGPPLYLNQKILEIVRALNWHRIASPFPVGGHEVHLSPLILADSWDLQIRKRWYSEGLNKIMTQRAPATVCRNISPIRVSSPRHRSDSSLLPYVVASQNPNGALSIATLGRVFPDAGYVNPAADITVTVEKLIGPIGCFGNFNQITIKSANVTPDFEIWAQDLAETEAVDVTSKVDLKTGSMRVPGQLAGEICAKYNDYDLSEPGLVIQLLKMES